MPPGCPAYAVSAVASCHPAECPRVSAAHQKHCGVSLTETEAWNRATDLVALYPMFMGADPGGFDDCGVQDRASRAFRTIVQFMGLVSDGSREVLMPTRYTALAKEIRTIRATLRQLQRSFDRLVPILMTKTSARSMASRKLQLTPARRAALKLQGQYMGYMRGLKPQQKSQVKKIRAAKGIRATIAMARRLAS